MLASTWGATPWGVEARLVEVEVDACNGLPQVHIVGLPDASVRESRERVRAAIRNCGFHMEPRAVVINLAPADLRKEGNHLDLAIALALLASQGHLPVEALAGRLFGGELGLDGAIRPIRGGLAIADLGARLGVREILLPAANSGEASALQAARIVAVGNLREAVRHMLGQAPLPFASPSQGAGLPGPPAPDLSDVRGQDMAKRALEVAAAGGHNLIFVGPPGSGKTLLARCLPPLLPPLTQREAIEVTKIHSVAAEHPPAGLLSARPFRSPHTGTSTAGMVGGGPTVRPGEVSLAHLGVMFLDELPEFKRDTLEALRQPLEEGCILIVRARARVSLPARFSLLAAMNPWGCMHLLSLTLRGRVSRPDQPAEPRTVGEHLKRARLDRRLGQTNAARELGCNPGTLLNWEKGRVAPDVRFWPAILRFLGYDPRPAPEGLGQRIRAAREAEGLSEEALARKLGIDPGTVGAWEGDQVSRPYPRIRRLFERYLALAEGGSVSRRERT